MLSLYVWWKVIRPNRKSPYAGLLDDTDFLDWFMASPPDPEYRNRMQVGIELERGYEREDEEMLIRLVRVRSNVW
jgi:hypothetical protein